jgi:predicted enzyme related to lactoylglutathione lyase
MEKMSINTNALNWFEIPVLDTVRARKFYETIFDIQMQTMDMKDMQMTVFPSTELPNGKVYGALVKSNFHVPSKDGSIIYLNANPSIQTVLDKIEMNGGKILFPKTLISEQIGYMAFFLDTEGNRVALHAGS